MNTKNLFYTIILFGLLWSCGKDDGPEMNKSSLANDPTSFITKWKIDNKREAIMIGTNDEIDLTYDYTIDWGDGTVEQLSEGNPQHTYSVSGVYSVAIKGQFPSIKIDELLYGRKHSSDLISIEQWGAIKWRSLEFAFQKCENMEYNAKDAPDLSEVTSLAYMFADAKKFLGADFNHWDVSNISNMEGLFVRTPCSDLDIGEWDVSKVTNMKDLFAGSKFNSNIGDWDVSNVTDMAQMFGAAKFFNADISEWDVSNVTDLMGTFAATDSFNQDIGGWNVSKVTNMGYIFSNAKSFNQDLSAWNVSSVNNMDGAFQYTELFDQNLGSWNIAKITNLFGMFTESKISPENYSRTLVGWSGQNVKQNVSLEAHGVFYCIGSEGEVARDILKNVYGWYIHDRGGTDCQ